MVMQCKEYDRRRHSSHQKYGFNDGFMRIPLQYITIKKNPYFIYPMIFPWHIPMEIPFE